MQLLSPRPTWERIKVERGGGRMLELIILLTAAVRLVAELIDLRHKLLAKRKRKNIR